MNLNIIKTAGKAAMKIGSKVGFKLKKASPEICLVGGVALIVGGTIYACKATQKASGELDEANAILGKIEEEREELETNPPKVETYNGVEIDTKALTAQRRDLTKDKLNVLFKTAGRMAKIYAPAVAAEGLGIALIFVSHGIMKKRNAALIGAYNALDGAFRRYRDRVREKLGDDDERKIYVGERKIEDIDDDKIVERTVYEEGIRGGNPNIFHFTRMTSNRFDSTPVYNLLILQNAEQWACDKLRLQGHLFLNEVLDYLGMDRTPDGAIRGWIYDKDDPENYVDFGLCEEVGQHEAWLCDSDSFKDDIVLRFNTHGIIWDRI